MNSSDFRAALDRADAASSSLDFYKELTNAQNLNVNSSDHTVILTAESTPSTDHAIEAGVRNAIRDKRNKTHPDAVFNGIPIEIKHASTSHSDFPNDSVGVTDTEEKWYIFLENPVKMGVPSQYRMWLTRSKELHAELKTLSTGLSPSKTPIDPNAPDALEKITAEIEAIKVGLAKAVLQKSRGQTRSEVEPADRQRMSMNRGVGVNSVRFNINFGPLAEKRLRAIISMILKG